MCRSSLRFLPARRPSKNFRATIQTCHIHQTQRWGHGTSVNFHRSFELINLDLKKQVGRKCPNHVKYLTHLRLFWRCCRQVNELISPEELCLQNMIWDSINHKPSVCRLTYYHGLVVSYAALTKLTLARAQYWGTSTSSCLMNMNTRMRQAIYYVDHF